MSRIKIGKKQVDRTHVASAIPVFRDTGRQDMRRKEYR
jgi:hypothetical protein